MSEKTLITLIEKQCLACEAVKPISEFYTNGTRYRARDNVLVQKYRPRCKPCELGAQRVGYLENIFSILNEKNIKIECCRCGYNESFAALEFHHLDRAEKDLNISRMRVYTKQRIEKELSKCILLCSNCHKIEHSSEIYLKELERLMRLS